MSIVEIVYDVEEVRKRKAGIINIFQRIADDLGLESSLRRTNSYKVVLREKKKKGFFSLRGTVAAAVLEDDNLHDADGGLTIQFNNEFRKLLDAFEVSLKKAAIEVLGPLPPVMHLHIKSYL